jgi:methylamine---corrinoid protein Co-methyltransferase
MNSALKYYERALDGERMDPEVFDTEVLPEKLQELVQKHEISYNREDVVPQDLDMAKRVFDAALELVTDLGIYFMDTRSIIKITRGEVLRALTEAPASHSIGTGAEAKECRARSIGDEAPPLIIGGVNGAPISEENYVKILTSYAKEPVDGLHTGTIQTLFGQEIRAKSPSELLVCKYEALWAREALLKAGKPGLSILGIMSGSTSESQNAGDFDGGLRPSDMHLVVFLNEMKADGDVFMKIAHNQFLGNIIDACMGGPIIGGYAGGPESAAVTAVAEIMAAYAITRPMTFSMYPVNLFSNVSSDRWTVWMSSMASMAFKASGHDLMLAMYQGAASGPCTEMLMNEIATQTIAHTTAGFSFIYGPVGCSMNKMDCFSGMEARMLSEISKAATGMSLSQANEITMKLNADYEDAVKSNTTPQGQNFSECYDTDRIIPSSEYVALWEEKKEKLAKMGLKF